MCLLIHIIVEFVGKFTFDTVFYQFLTIVNFEVMKFRKRSFSMHSRFSLSFIYTTPASICGSVTLVISNKCIYPEGFHFNLLRIDNRIVKVLSNFHVLDTLELSNYQSAKTEPISLCLFGRLVGWLV